jgi:hypothetical protein
MMLVAELNFNTIVESFNVRTVIRKKVWKLEKRNLEITEY